MQTTTIYRETLTITTDDDGARTVTRHEYADTNTEFYFTELAPKAQERAIRDAIEEERNSYAYGAGHTQTEVDEIWYAYNAIAKDQPIQWHDHYWSFFLTVEDAERVTPEEAPSVIVWGKAHEDAADRCREKAEELAEKAKDALEHEVKALIEGAEEYYQSEEFWREWYSEGDERFTRDGERI